MEHVSRPAKSACHPTNNRTRARQTQRSGTSCGRPDDCDFDEDDGLFKPNSAQKKKKSTKPNVKDEENSSVRTPLEVYNDFLSDKLSSMNLTDEQKRTLVDKASQLVEVSPDCDCVKYGCQGEKKICLKK